MSIQEKFNFLRLFANSLIVAVLKTGIAIYTSAVLGYVFSKMHSCGRNLLFGIVMSTMMIPWAVTIIPQYEMFTKLGSARHLHVARASWHDQRIRYLPVPPIHLGNF